MPAASCSFRWTELGSPSGVGFGLASTRPGPVRSPTVTSDTDLPRIIDPHVHLWDPRTTPRQITPLVKLVGRWPRLLEKLARAATPGPLIDFVGDPQHVLSAHLTDDFSRDAGHHHVAGIVHVEAGWTARGTLGPVGETRWLDHLDPAPLGIVGHATVDDPDALEAQLDAHSLASGRLRGIRDILAAHPDKRVHTWTDPNRIRSDALRSGLTTLGERQLTFEAWCYHHQLPDLAQLISDVPMTTFMLDHMGTPVGLAGPHGGQGTTERDRAAILDDWRAGLVDIAANLNVHCKLSGLLMPICGFGYHERDTPPSVAELVDAIGPHIHFGIETFGPERCVFASNFPMDKVSTDYQTLWDAFIEIVANAGLAPAQQAALLADNAAAFYRLEVRDEHPDG